MLKSILNFLIGTIGLALLTWGIALTHKLIADFLFIRKNRFFFEEELKIKKMVEDPDKWEAKWKKQNKKYPDLEWSYNIKKKRFPKAVKDSFLWLGITVAFVISLSILWGES